MIKELINPKTKNYYLLKNQIFSPNFPWHFIETTIPNESSDYAASPYFSHAIVRPPLNPNLFPSPYSSYAELCNSVLQEILEYNKLNINSILRINVNMTLPLSQKPTQPHYDHSFEHQNLLIYLNNSDGPTIVENEKCYPDEDKIIIFKGLHHHYLPSIGKRIVLVTTFI